MKLLPIAPPMPARPSPSCWRGGGKSPQNTGTGAGRLSPGAGAGNFRDKDVDTLLDLMRQAQVTIPLKAVVTPANRNWMFADLLAHLQEEHTAFTAAKESQTV